MQAEATPPSPPTLVRPKDEAVPLTPTAAPTTNSGWFSKLKIPTQYIRSSFDYSSPPNATSPKLSEKVDHVIFLVHGIGPHEEKWKVTMPRVEKSYRKASQYLGSTIKIKFIPVEWHALVHSKTDEPIARVTPKGILNTRSFVNNTLIDILLWAHSPYSQTIYDDVCTKLNKLHHTFMKENPDFTGDFSIFAHSLGSLICYDLLAQQPNMDEYTYKYERTPPADDEFGANGNPTSPPTSPPNSPKGKSASHREGNVSVWKRMRAHPDGASEAKPEKTVNMIENIVYPAIEFAVENLFMLGSPAGIFLTTRSIGEVSVKIPKCNNMFNIYNPSDPVTYLIEPLIDEGFLSLPSAMCPHFTNQSMKGAVAKSKSLISFYKNYYVKGNGNIDDVVQNAKDTVTVETNYEISVKESTTVITNTNEGNICNSTTTTTTSEVLCVENSKTLENSSKITENSKTVENSTKTQENSTKTQENSKILENPAPKTTENTVPPALSPQLNNTPLSTTVNQNVPLSQPVNPNAPLSTPINTSTVNKDVFFDGKRFDYRMQPSGIVENISEYASVINAHRCYWGSKDVMLFIVQHLMANIGSS